VAAATEFPGLKYYLPCDAIVDGRVIDAISGQPVGKLSSGAEVTDGPRGKGLRLTSPKRGVTDKFALDLTDQVNDIAIPDNQPFTLSVWVRLPKPTETDLEVLSGSEYRWQRLRSLHFRARSTSVKFSLSEPLGADVKGKTLNFEELLIRRKESDRTGWFHLAMIRRRDGNIQTFIDGDSDRTEPSMFSAEIKYKSFGFLPPSPSLDQRTADIAEFCLFDHALTADELARLGGRKSERTPASTAQDTTQPPTAPETYPVLAPSELTGLKFYFPCDKVADGGLMEAVSGKSVGRFSRGAVEEVAGPRGAALRLSVDAPGTDTTPYAFTTSKPEEAFQIPAKQPFTLAMWVRIVQSPPTDTCRIFSGRVKNSPAATSSQIWISYAKGRAGGGIRSPRGPVPASCGVTDPSKWFHVAMTRNSNGTVQFLIDGVFERSPGAVTSWEEGRWEILELVPSSNAHTPVTVEVADICLFDRLLENDEIGALAGKKPAPKKKPQDPSTTTPPVKPKVDPVARGPRPATDFPGLKFYLPCDTLTDGKLTEAVSGKPVGMGAGLELTDGVRGKAIRLTHDRQDTNRYALDLTDQVGVLAVPADKPCTLSFWVRRTTSNAVGGHVPFLIEASTPQKANYHRSFTIGLSSGVPASFFTTIGDTTNRFDLSTAKARRGNHQLSEPAKWNHIAFTRDEMGETRWLVNGTAEERGVAFPLELRYDTFGLVRSINGKTIIDLDEFCLFDRLLRDNELTELTGLKIIRPKAPEGAKGPTPGSVPAPDEIKGLKFHLACDKLEKGAVLESVSGKFVGKSTKSELVDGPRGKALRTTAGGPGTRTGLDLSAQADDLAIAAGKPFTMTLWVRTDDWDSNGPHIIYGKSSTTDKFRTLSLYRNDKGIGFLLQESVPGGRPDPGNQSTRDYREFIPTREWFHIALSRDDRGAFRWAVNGEAKQTNMGTFTAEMRFSEFALGWQSIGTFPADYDEFCLFDRALTDDEIKKLAGRAK
jgi:hypothetical protein